MGMQFRYRASDRRSWIARADNRTKWLVYEIVRDKKARGAGVRG
jgi:hypothetical protein